MKTHSRKTKYFGEKPYRNRNTVDNTSVFFFLLFTVDVYLIILKEHNFDSGFTKLSNETSSSFL